MFRNIYQTGVISILSARGSHPLQLWDVRSEEGSSDPGDRGGGKIRRVLRPTNVEYDAVRYSSGGMERGGGDVGVVDVVVDHDDDDDADGPYIEIDGIDLSRNYITCPPASSKGSDDDAPTTIITTRPSLGITLPYLYVTVRMPPKSDTDFSFEVTILDDGNTLRRFRASTYASTTVIRPDICVMPLRFEMQRGQRIARDEFLLPIGGGGSGGFDSEDDVRRCHYAPRSASCDGDGVVIDRDDDGDDIEKTQSCWNRLCLPLSEYTRRAYGTKFVETVWVRIHANCRLKRVYFAEREMNEDDELPGEFRLYHRR
ncbi:hypothetical protein ACHAXA_010622 [Cyclostephanos tholiformis]|uniref:CFA20 domain-containing protein n=1 Tax=Cyclostephanos tholiformis TaxID=382380 RepID=A0ABD3RBJ1_9STRA